MITFEQSCTVPGTAQDLFNYHARQGAFQRLAPPWEKMQILEQAASLVDGSQLVFRIYKGPFHITWRAEHDEVIPGSQFIDHQVEGPFSAWAHLHQFTDAGSGSARLIDQLKIQPPGGKLGSLLAGSRLKKDLSRLFAFRHDRTFRDLLRFQQFPNPKTIVFAGPIPQWCTQLAYFLSVGGHRVFRVERQSEDRYVMRSIGGETDHPLDACDAILLASEPDPASAPGDPEFGYLDFLVRAVGTTYQPPKRLIQLMLPPRNQPNWQQDPQIPTSVAPPQKRLEIYEAKLAALSTYIPQQTRVFLGALIEPHVKRMIRLLLRLETFLFLQDHVKTPVFNWISREDVFGSLLFLLNHPEIQEDVALIHPKVATRAQLQRMLLKHHFGPYALQRIFQIVGWAAPGHTSELNQHLLSMPPLTDFGFQPQTTSLEQAFCMEFGIPHDGSSER